MNIQRIKRLFQRQPVIYDLWAHIRMCWALADYFDGRRMEYDKWQEVLKHFQPHPEATGVSIHQDGRQIAFYRYPIK